MPRSPEEICAEQNSTPEEEKTELAHSIREFNKRARQYHREGASPKQADAQAREYFRMRRQGVFD